jgi:hypothetical protein
MLLSPNSPLQSLSFMFPGLHLVSYGGGDSFREATVLYHASVLLEEKSELGVKKLSVREFIRRSAADAFASAGATDVVACGLAPLHPESTIPGSALELIGMDSSPISDDEWASATWEAAVVVSTPVHSSPTANLFFHGWIHGGAANSSCSAAQSFPLIGVIRPAGCIGEVDRSSFPEPRELSPGPYDDAPCDGRLKPADCHIHLVDPLAGGTREEFIALLVESGLDIDAASAHADAEQAMALSYHLGADMARVGIRPSATEPVGSAWVVCLNRQPGSLRILLTLLLVVESRTDCSAVLAATGSGAVEDCGSVLTRIFYGVPALVGPVVATCASSCWLPRDGSAATAALETAAACPDSATAASASALAEAIFVEVKS